MTMWYAVLLVIASTLAILLAISRAQIGALTFNAEFWKRQEDKLYKDRMQLQDEREKLKAVLTSANEDRTKFRAGWVACLKDKDDLVWLAELYRARSADLFRDNGILNATLDRLSRKVAKAERATKPRRHIKPPRL